ncbi:hypothetical protein I7I50_04459 [Histoplasma capsulatum G186AR]|uniref:Uncharacterized protein n=1 Tax=Ajellomyces capsulatus TaxID=5037 RepID=A0A8H8CX68_AJECA|nr:hypothetical protein I7I52_05367 [Histoplasma capsulatum]QSS75348.1 hypothetical protein I7I50_04459 [Histoplasma capsulatum G186AR]
MFLHVLRNAPIGRFNVQPLFSGKTSGLKQLRSGRLLLNSHPACEAASGKFRHSTSLFFLWDVDTPALFPTFVNY